MRRKLYKALSNVLQASHSGRKRTYPTLVSNERTVLFFKALERCMFEAFKTEDFFMIHGIVKTLTMQAWFELTPLSEKQCTRMALNYFIKGTVDPAELSLVCEKEARERFSRPDLTL